MKLNDFLKKNKSAVLKYNFRSIGYRHKIYNICNSVNAGIYAVPFRNVETYYSVPTFIGGQI